MLQYHDTPDSKIHGANMGPIWGRQDPGGPHVGPMNFAIWDWMRAKDIAVHTRCSDHSINTSEEHDDVIKRKHFPRHWPLCEVNPHGQPSQRPVTRRFEVVFDLHLNKQLSKQSRRPWLELLSRSSWRHCHKLCTPFSLCCLLLPFDGGRLICLKVSSAALQ